MHHTITGRAQPNGLEFEPHQLGPVGIQRGGTAWGVFVDSPNLDERSNLSDPKGTYNNQSLHMMVSPIHPDRWLSCFRLQVLLERKETDPDRLASTSVLFGLFDALSRCGVNVLDSSKALLGYNAVSLVATCEFPTLRVVAHQLMRKHRIDELAIEIGKDRPAEFDPERRAKLQELRTKVLAEIGRRLIHHLTVLQARLMLTDESRQWWEASERFRSIFDPISPDSPPGTQLGNDHGINDTSNCGLRNPWFVHRRILSLSENPFYIVHPDELESRHEWSSFPKHSTEFTGCLPEVADGVFESLFKRWHDLDRDKTLSGSHGDRPESSFWAKVGKLTSAADLRKRILRGVLTRSYIQPILLSPMPTLSYGRVWALPFEGDQGEYESCMEFKYDGRLLYPNTSGTESSAFDPSSISSAYAPKDGMTRLYQTMNKWAGFNMLDNNPSAIGPRAMPVGGVNLIQRFVRLRFVRRCTEHMWAQVQVRFGSKGAFRKDATATHLADNQHQSNSSRGLLAVFAGLIAEKGFRIEDVTHRYDYIGPDAERGFVIFTIQCASPEAEKCLKHYDEFTAGLNSEAKAKLNDYSITVVSVSVSLGRPMFDC